MICYEEQVEGCKQRSCSGNRSYETFEAVEEQFIAHFLWTVGQYWFVGRFLKDFWRFLKVASSKVIRSLKQLRSSLLHTFCGHLNNIAFLRLVDVGCVFEQLQMSSWVAADVRRALVGCRLKSGCAKTPSPLFFSSRNIMHLNLNKWQNLGQC